MYHSRDKSWIFATISHSGTIWECIESKKEGKDQESIQSSTTPDPGYKWEGNKPTIIYHKQEPRGQPFHRNNINDPQNKHRLGTVSKNILLEIW